MLYSTAFTFGIPKLIKQLEKHIVEDAKFLRADNASQYLIEAVRVTSFIINIPFFSLIASSYETKQERCYLQASRMCLLIRVKVMTASTNSHLIYSMRS